MGVKRIILPLLLLWPLLMHAQYAAVDWEASRGDSLLPVCSSVVDLPDDCWQYDYTAHIEYPELEKMTAADVRRYSLETVYDSLPAMPAVECYVGVQAKHAQLDVAFLPVVMRGGEYVFRMGYGYVEREHSHVQCRERRRDVLQCTHIVY